MKVYRVKFDCRDWIVEAETMNQAIAIWEEHVKVEWGKDYDGTEEPEECAIVGDGPVLRRAT